MPIVNKIRSLLKAEDGTILVFWGVSFAILFGIIALSFDIGRVAATRSELQSYVDHVALAAAGELDGNVDSITRAISAANTLISDTQTYGNGTKALSGSANYGLTFYSSLPASDTGSVAGGLTTVAADANYARVEVIPQNVDLTFSAAFTALTGRSGVNNNATAVAVAGFTQYACDITPLMFCMPSSNFDPSDPTTVGDMMLLRSGGQGAAWGPGDFGFLDPSGIKVDPAGPCAGLSPNGGQMRRCLLGAEEYITQCFPQKGVTTDPGQSNGITTAAFNVRFDMYKGSMASKKNDISYAPAPNVIKGIVDGTKSCINNSESSPNTVGLPHDDCFPGCGRFGDGNWTNGRIKYVNTNYGGGAAGTIDPHPTANTRYEYYQAEINAAGVGNDILPVRPIVPGYLSETGRPQCSNKQSLTHKRRVVIAAGIDCVKNPIAGRTSNVPVSKWVEMFITEPVGSTGTSPPVFDFWVEIIGDAERPASGNGATIHDVVQLYR